MAVVLRTLRHLRAVGFLHSVPVWNSYIGQDCPSPVSFPTQFYSAAVAALMPSVITQQITSLGGLLKTLIFVNMKNAASCKMNNQRVMECIMDFITLS